MYMLFPFTEGISAQIPNITTTPSTPQPTSATTSTNLQITCSKMIEYVIKSDLFRLRVAWNRESACEGQLYVYSRERKGPLCFASHMSGSWWTEVCKDIRCGDLKGFKLTSSQIKGLILSSNMTFVDTTKCNGLYIMCQGVCVRVYFQRTVLLYRLYMTRHAGMFLLMLLFLIRFHRQNNCYCDCI